MHNKYKEILVKIIKKHLPDCKIYLFGSRARKDALCGSDIDLALECKDTIDHIKIFKIYKEIEKTTLPLFVDLVDLKAAPEELKKQIKKDGISWTD